MPTVSLCITLGQLGIPSAVFRLVANPKYNNKKIIINTNLQISEITKMYSMRFTSRLYEYFMMYKFYGEDIRIQKLRRS